MNTILLAAANTAPAATTGDSTYIVWGAALLGLFLFLVVIELFLPSGGLIGLLAGIAAIGSVIAFFKYDNTWGWASIGVYIVLVPAIVWFFLKVWLTSSFGRQMILGGDELETETGSDNAVIASERKRRERLAELTALIGSHGVAATALRPVGTVRIDDRLVDAMSETGIIEPGEDVVVTDAYDNQIKVRARG